jgi:hypothetical protein
MNLTERLLIRYILYMNNWGNVDEAMLKKDPERYRLWRTVQMINYGLGEEKLEEGYLKDNWSTISSMIDPDKQKVLEYMLKLS